MSIKKIVILGSTGSIGKSAIDVVKNNPDKFRVIGLSADKNVSELYNQAKAFRVKHVAINNKVSYKILKGKLGKKYKIYCGIDGICNLAALKDADLILLAISGTESLRPLMSSIKAGKRIALASKEALVSAGELVTKAAYKQKAELFPVDSEHSAIFQCLEGRNVDFLKKVYLTGTGGPLRTIPGSMFDKLPFSKIVTHPKWKMGKKITVDSATLMNKGLELIEAKWLFNLKPDKINIILHPEAIIHSMVEFIDGTVLANMFYPDMRIPIQYAFSYPDRLPNRYNVLDFYSIKKLNFEKPNYKKFPALGLVDWSLKKGKTYPCVLNASNEQAVRLFLDRKIKFSSITKLIEKTMEKHKPVSSPTIEDILHVDQWAKNEVKITAKL